MAIKNPLFLAGFVLLWTVLDHHNGAWGGNRTLTAARTEGF